MSMLNLRDPNRTDPAFNYLGKHNGIFVIREHGEIVMCFVNWKVVRCGPLYLIENKAQWKSFYGMVRTQEKQSNLIN